MAQESAGAPTPVSVTDDSSASLPPVDSNDNRNRGGHVAGGVLTLALRIGEGIWHPTSADGVGIHIFSFGVENGPLQTPGPLVRVSEGTEMHVLVHNQLLVPVTVHGLFTRGREEDDPLRLASGETKAVTFAAGMPGTYLYRARTSGDASGSRAGMETMLSGAFIVDPPGTVADDRVFVLQRYRKDELKPTFQMVNSINGKSWPDTERLNLRLGKTVHWRVLNASDWPHPMHLHGSYFRVDGVSDNVREQDYPESERRMAVTELVDHEHAFVMSWTPVRPGNWLFHCHILEHIGGPPSTVHYARESEPPKVATAEHSHSLGMSGLVLGITVRGRAHPAEVAPSTVADTRRLQLFIRNRPASSYVPAGPGFYLEGVSTAPGVTGPPLVLTRGEPTAITVTNELGVPTAIHWHGMELESYYDGVPGWTGSPERPTPAITPGGSFTALMTPTRAGTFIYHTHWHDSGQLAGGLYGPLIVMEPGERFDPTTDRVFIIGRAGPNDRTDPLVINGSAQPASTRLVEGQHYRLRLINITPNDDLVTASLFRGDELVTWKALAKDGAALPAQQALEQPARQRVALGETYDFEFAPQFSRDDTGRPIRYRLSFLSDLLSVGASQWFVVRPQVPSD